MKALLCILGMMTCAQAEEMKEIVPWDATPWTAFLQIQDSAGQEYIGIKLVKPEEPFCIFKAGDECVIRWTGNALHFSRPISVTGQQKP